jgi:hypothetical protein
MFLSVIKQNSKIMKLKSATKAILLLSVCLFYSTDICLGQQWAGSSDLTGLLYRSGDIRANDLFLGKYGREFLGSTDPFAIYSPETSGNQDLLLFGNGIGGTLNLRLHDGSLKIGPSTTPNAVVHNDGRAWFTNLVVGMQGAAAQVDINQGTLPLLRLRGGNDKGVYGKDQVLFSWNGGTGYSHAVKTRHNAADATNNAIDFFVWKPGDAVDGAGSNFVMTLNGGSVGIGTQNPDPLYKLSVNGKIRAMEIKVETGWADFVFTPGYRLRPLAEVEAHIKDHGHLPDVPSAQQVQAEGVDLGKANTLLLQKVEELTLYLIEQEKKVIEQEKKAIEQEKKTRVLEERLEQLQEGGKRTKIGGKK